MNIFALLTATFSLPIHTPTSIFFYIVNHKKVAEQWVTWKNRSDSVLRPNRLSEQQITR